MRVRVSSLLLAAFLLSNAGPALAASEGGFAEPVSQAVEYVQSRGLLSVESDGLFHPEQQLTRMDLLLAVVRDVYARDVRETCFGNIASSLYSVYTHLFRDIPKTDMHAKEVCVGIFVGMLNGESDGTFRGDVEANLAETAKVVSKAYGIAPFQGLYPNPEVPWHESFWYALAKRNAIPESVKSRGQKLTRGEFSEILWRLRGDHPLVSVRSEYVAVQKPLFQQKEGQISVSGIRETVNGKIVSALYEAKNPTTPLGIAVVKNVEKRLQERLDRVLATQKLQRVLSEYHSIKG